MDKGKEGMMAAEETGEKSFEALVREAPEAPATGTVSLVGTLPGRAKRANSSLPCRTAAQ